jgi:hypothetical protein
MIRFPFPLLALVTFGIFMPLVEVQAHAFGTRHELPVPLWLFVIGAGAAVALSFVVAPFLLRSTWLWRRALASQWPKAGRILVMALRLFTVCALVMVWSAAAFGTDETLENLAPTAVWVMWWLGIAYACAVFGNVWALINPFDTIFRLGATLFPRSTRYRCRDWPEWLGRWPAAVALLAFAWIEMVSEFGETPRGLAWTIGLYALVTWAGMIIWGRARWLNYADPFAVFFGLIGRFGIFAGRLEQGPAPAVRAFWFRLPAVGLAERRLPTPGTLAVVIVMLSTVSFDGFRETPLWQEILSWVASDMNLRPFLLLLRDQGIDLLAFIESAGFLLSPLLFAAVYLVFARAMVLMSPTGHATLTVAAMFATSMIPIAIAYHLAHYVSYFLLAGQLFLPLLSDPFGWGWNLVGTAHQTIDVTIVNARLVWHISVVAVVTGHVAAVVVAHLTARALYQDESLVRRSQIPMIVLMVLYTMSSLWILAQPVVLPSADL